MEKKKYYTSKQIMSETDISRDILRETRDLLFEKKGNLSKKSKSRGKPYLYSETLRDLLRDYRNISGKLVLDELKIEHYSIYFCVSIGVNTDWKHTKYSTSLNRKVLLQDLTNIKRAMPAAAMVYTIDADNAEVCGLIKPNTYTMQEIDEKFSSIFYDPEYLWFTESVTGSFLADEFKASISEDGLTLQQDQMLYTTDALSLRIYLPNDWEKIGLVGYNGKISTPHFLELKWRKLLG